MANACHEQNRRPTRMRTPCQSLWTRHTIRTKTKHEKLVLQYWIFFRLKQYRVRARRRENSEPEKPQGIISSRKKSTISIDRVLSVRRGLSSVHKSPFRRRKTTTEAMDTECTGGTMASLLRATSYPRNEIRTVDFGNISKWYLELWEDVIHAIVLERPSSPTRPAGSQRQLWVATIRNFQIIISSSTVWFVIQYWGVKFWWHETSLCWVSIVLEIISS